MEKNEISFGGTSGFPEEDSTEASRKPAMFGETEAGAAGGSNVDGRATGERDAYQSDPGRAGGQSNPGSVRDDATGQALGVEATGQVSESGNAELIPGRPPTTPQEYQRVMFLARLVLGFTVLAAFTLEIVTVASGKSYASAIVGIILVVAATGYYAWTSRAVKRDMEENPNHEPEE